ncbi:hypothetical protein [Prosthecobacter sp.]|uniref:hypothetical protein n=1 Tax=Prosthecobacter sp. TaxID=1965333 RepID=UPI0037848F1D
MLPSIAMTILDLAPLTAPTHNPISRSPIPSQAPHLREPTPAPLGPTPTATPNP